MKPNPKTKKQTQSSLAAVLGISRQLVAAHIKRGDAPKLDDVAGWHAHLAAYGRTGSQASSETKHGIAAERLGLLKAMREKAERENKVASGELMPCADAVRQATEACAFVDSELQRDENELPPILAGLSAVECGKILHQRTERMRVGFKQKFEEVGK